MSQSKREELWEDLLEERGPIFADHRVKEFVDDLIQYKKIRGDGVDLGGEIDLIARRGEDWSKTVWLFCRSNQQE